MTGVFELRWGIAIVALSTGGCASRTPPQPIAMPPPPAIVADVERAGAQVRSTIVDGDSVALRTRAVAPRSVKLGTVSANLPNVEVRTVAASVQDLTGIPIEVDPGVTGQLSLVTPGIVARSEIITLFESGLRTANLALVPVGKGYLVRTIAAAQAPVASDAIGFGTEIVSLQFINADDVRKVIDGALPGVVTAIDAASNRVTIAGTTGQRSSARDLLKQFDVNWLRNMSFALFVPERTDSRLIVPELDKLLNASDAPTRGLVRLITMERLNGILAVTTQAQYLDDVRRWIEILDREGESAERRVFVYRVQNGRAKDLAGTLNRVFGKGGDEGGSADPFAPADQAMSRSGPASPRPSTGTNLAGLTSAGSNGAGPRVAGGTDATSATDPQHQASDQTGKITADEVNNAIVVFGTPRNYAMIEDALRKLDVPPVQVMIEAAITEVTLTDTLRYGVQWSWLTGDSNFRLTDGATVPAGPTQSGFSYFLAGGSISAALNALEQRTNIKVVSAPKLVTLNNQTAALQVGDQVPVSSGSAVSVENPTAPIVNAIEYRDTGVILKVTPRVNAGGLVLLDISQEVSDVNTSAPAASGDRTPASPTISTRRISTSVAVQDGQVIALGGLFRESKSIGRNGLPILSRIPVLGGLFGSHNNTQTRTELIVLLKPHVIRTPDDGRAITEELRSKLRTLEPFRTKGTIP